MTARGIFNGAGFTCPAYCVHGPADGHPALPSSFTARPRSFFRPRICCKLRRTPPSRAPTYTPSPRKPVVSRSIVIGPRASFALPDPGSASPSRPLRPGPIHRHGCPFPPTSATVSPRFSCLPCATRAGAATVDRRGRPRCTSLFPPRDRWHPLLPCFRAHSRPTSTNGCDPTKEDQPQ